MQAMPAATKESTRAGPVLSWAATPVSTKIPVPMIAPMPMLVSCSGPSTRGDMISSRWRAAVLGSPGEGGATGWGVFMAVWTVVVGLMDNVLRPVLMARGLQTPMSIILAGGRRIEVPRGFDVETLRRVVVALEQA